jgi:hypothetical protein
MESSTEATPQSTPQKFTADNFKSGFLVDEELMAGISEDQPGQFTAFVVRHSTGEMLGAHQYENVFEAIRALNDIPRNWTYESVKRCGGGNCANGKCAAGGCGKKSAPSTAENAAENTEATQSCDSGQCAN